MSLGAHRTFADAPISPIPIPEVRIRSEQSNRGFWRPILAQSPRPQRDVARLANDDDVILPDPNFVLKPDAVEPESGLRDVLLCEAEENLRRAEREWRDAVERERAAGKQRLTELIGRHSEELSRFDAENRVPRTIQTSPQQIRLIGPVGNGLVRARIIGAGARSALGGETMVRRKVLVDRHMKEILALKTELEDAMDELLKRRTADLAIKREQVRKLGGDAPDVESVDVGDVGVVRVGRGI